VASHPASFSQGCLWAIQELEHRDQGHDVERRLTEREMRGVSQHKGKTGPLPSSEGYHRGTPVEARNRQSEGSEPVREVTSAATHVEEGMRFSEIVQKPSQD